jgi:hypothetical protein
MKENEHGKSCACPACTNVDWSKFETKADDCNCPGCRFHIIESFCHRDERVRVVKGEIKLNEYRRLKRLAENVKKKTIEAKIHYDIYVNNNSAHETIRSCIEALKLLESLSE